MNAVTDASGYELQQHGTHAFPCAAYHTQDTGFSWHWHEEMEMIFVLEGRLTVAAADKRYVLSGGEAIVINTNVPHALYPGEQEHYQECDVVFHPRLIYGSTDSALWENCMRDFLRLSSGELESVPLRADVFWQKEAAERICAACALCGEKPPLYEFDVREHLTRVCLAIFSHRTENAAPARKPQAGRVKSMMRYLEKRMSEDVTLGELALFAHLSVRECQREFKSCIGITPGQYLSQIRLSRAEELLREGNDSVTQVGVKSGYQSPSYFAGQFRARFGASPREYAKKAK